MTSEHKICEVSMQDNIFPQKAVLIGLTCIVAVISIIYQDSVLGNIVL